MAVVATIAVIAGSTHFHGNDVTSELTVFNDKATTLIDELLWWTQALKSARSGEAWRMA